MNGSAAPRPVIVPVQLGCCHEAVRCLLCPPPPPVSAALVEALVHSYRDAQPNAPLEVRFFGGPPPDDALLDAVGDLPFSIRVRPDLLNRTRAVELHARAVRQIELDALSWQRVALRATGRSYGEALLQQLSDGLDALGVRVGGVLAPGLPGQDHTMAVLDATRAAAHWRFARLHPVLVLDRAGLRELLEQHRYVPLELGEAVTVCHDMLEVLEAAGVEVVRIGVQPGPDGLGRAVAGPRHSSLRELVEARRVLHRLREACRSFAPGDRVQVRCAPADETRTRGPFNLHLRTLRADHHLAEVVVLTDPTLPRGALRVHALEETS